MMRRLMTEDQRCVSVRQLGRLECESTRAWLMMWGEREGGREKMTRRGNVEDEEEIQGVGGGWWS